MVSPAHAIFLTASWIWSTLLQLDIASPLTYDEPGTCYIPDSKLDLANSVATVEQGRSCFTCNQKKRVNLTQQRLAWRGLYSFQQQQKSWANSVANGAENWERRRLQDGGLAIDMHKPLHYRLRRPIGFWKVQKVGQSRHLFLID